jgi:outer membrane protein
MKLIKKLLFSLILLTTFSGITALADTPHFVDFKYILNNSVAGKQAQTALQKKLNNGIKKLQAKESKIQSEEQEIIKQKKLISAEEYRNKVTELRKKVTLLQKEREILLNDVGKKRAKARSELLKNLNPLIKEYMQEKKIRMVIDKKSILLADEKLDVTQEIIELLNKKLKSIKLD